MVDANASNPVRFSVISGFVLEWASGAGALLLMVLKSADAPIRGEVPILGLDEGNGVVLVLAHGEDLVENRLGPLTDAKGELVAA